MSSSRDSESRPGKAPADPLPPVVLLISAEATLRDEVREALRQTALAGGSSDFNEDRFDLSSSGLDPNRILGAARTLPMLGPRRLVLVRGLEDTRARRFLEGPLLSYLEDPVATTILLLDAARADRRERWVKRVAQVGEVRVLDPPRRPADLRAWIADRFAKGGIEAASGVPAALLEAIGDDLDRLSHEIEKLCLFAVDRGHVTVDDVSDACGALRALAVYELTDAVGHRRPAQALRTLGRLLDQGQAPLLVLAALASHFRRLLRASECTPLEARQVQKSLGLHPFAARKLVEQVRAFGVPRIRSAMAALRRSDEVLKGAVPLSPRHALEQLVMAICG